LQWPYPANQSNVIKDYQVKTLCCCAELPFLATAGKLQLALHDTDLDTKTVVVVEDANEGATLVFENEAEAGDFNFPAPSTNRSLEDTWRIEPDQLKCRKKADGELWKLGQGAIETS
jgi:hypothetical protein